MEGRSESRHSHEPGAARHGSAARDHRGFPVGRSAFLLDRLAETGGSLIPASFRQVDPGELQQRLALGRLQLQRANQGLAGRHQIASGGVDNAQHSPGKRIPVTVFENLADHPPGPGQIKLINDKYRGL